MHTYIPLNLVATYDRIVRRHACLLTDLRVLHGKTVCLSIPYLLVQHPMGNANYGH